jgi:hypothetical protein
VAPGDPGATGRLGLLLDPVRGRCETARRAPGGEPAIAVARGAAQGGFGTSADRDRQGRVRGGTDPGLLEAEELALEVEGLTPEQSAQRREAGVRAAAPGSGVDAADLDLVAVLAADARSENDSPRSGGAERRELARDGDRMTQGQQVHAHVDAEGWLGGGCGGGLDEAVHAEAVSEADVVRHEDVVDPERYGAIEQAPPLRQDAVEDVVVGEGADPDLAHRKSLRGPASEAASSSGSGLCSMNPGGCHE